MNGQPIATLYFRKPWPVGSYSLEASFAAMLEAYPQDARVRPRRHVSPWYSHGILPRLRALLEARRAVSEVNHVTGDVHFLVLALPGQRTLLTIHDCGFLHASRGLRRLIYERLWLRWPVRRAALVSVVSEASRREVIALSGCAPEKVLVVPTSIDSAYAALAVLARPRALPARPLLLHVGATPNKNLERHLAALRDMPVRLLIIARLDPQQMALVDRSGLDVEVRASLTAAQMRAAYEEADVLLFASTFEGFGMPILEAQSVGRPVVTANVSSMPEVAGDAACLVDPFSVDSIRAGVQRVLADAAYREALVLRGVRNVERFSAANTAQRYAQIYAGLAGVTHAAASDPSAELAQP